jgi:hypothetical protein
MLQLEDSANEPVHPPMSQRSGMGRKVYPMRCDTSFVKTIRKPILAADDLSPRRPFEAVTAFITEDEMRGVFGVGPDASSRLAVAHQFVDAGYDYLALINAGPGPEGYFDFFASELAEPLRKPTPSS